MGRRRTENIPPEIWRERAPSVWRMIADGWRVSGQCLKCGARHELDLVSVGIRLSPQYSLWDRVPRCRQVGCWGAVRLTGHPPGFPSYGVGLCAVDVVRRKQVELDEALKARLAKLPDPDDPKNFGG